MNFQASIVGILALSILATGAGEHTNRFIRFSYHGFWTIKSAELVIEGGGLVDVKFEAGLKENGEYKFELKPDELEGITNLVLKVKFFDQPERLGPAIDVGDSSLSVQLGKQSRTLNYQHRPELSPLHYTLWSLIYQAFVTVELESKGKIYEAAAACNTNLTGLRVYNSSWLVAPMKKFAEQCSDRQKLECCFTGLSHVLTNEQWLEFVRSQLETTNTDRKAVLIGVLGSHPFYRNIPEGHMRVLLPFLTQVLEYYAKAGKPIDKSTDESLGAVCRFVGQMNYDAAIPTLQHLMTNSQRKFARGWADWAIKAIESKRNLDLQEGRGLKPQG